jgi:hypothetical protein
MMSRYLYTHSDVKGPLLACLTARGPGVIAAASVPGRDRQPLTFVIALVPVLTALHDALAGNPWMPSVPDPP